MIKLIIPIYRQKEKTVVQIIKVKKTINLNYKILK